ncbi:uncharacterized protein [Nerophis lumbriciformis]|uniref:uncharacterized protein n=1 Tax=Nerophis lumbriciformis TaxID=546530 RepID=UPI002ADF0F2B|nr:probable maltase-glucoamylase 2 [Nerophis lumbriciformis]
MNLLFFVLLAVQMQSVSPVIHDLSYFQDIESEDSYITKYNEWCHLDADVIWQYNSTNRNVLPQQNWMKKITAEDPQYWQRATETSVAVEQFCRNMYEPHMKYYTSPEDTYLGMWGSGCQWDEDTDEITGWYWDRFDGGDDYVARNPWRWTAAKEQADPPKLIWDGDRAPPEYFKDHIENCPSDLKKYLAVLLRTDLPMVSLNQKTPSSPVSCNATGFYPDDKAVMFWRKDGEKLLEGVEQTEMLENQDGTFQMSVDLKVAGDMEGKYECVFQLTGVKEDIVTKLESRSVLSNLSGEDLNTSTSGDTTTESQATIRPSTTSGTFDVTTESNQNTTRPSSTNSTLDVTTESNQNTTRRSTTNSTLDVTTKSNQNTTRPSSTNSTLDVTTESNQNTTRPSSTNSTLDVTTESNQNTTRPSTTNSTLDVTTESNQNTTRPSTTNSTLDVTTESNQNTTRPSTTNSTFDVTTESYQNTTRPSTTNSTFDVTTESNQNTTRPSTTNSTFDVTTESNQNTTRPSTTNSTLDVTTESNQNTTRPSTTNSTLDVTTESNQNTTRPSSTNSTFDVTAESNQNTTRPSTTNSTLDSTTDINQNTTKPIPELTKSKDHLEDKVCSPDVCIVCVVATTVILTTVVYLSIAIIIVMVKRYRKTHAPDPVVLVSMRMLPE